MSSSSSSYRTPVFIGLLCVMCFAVVLLLHHCVLLTCRNRRRRRTQHQGQEQEQDARYNNSSSSSSRVQLVKGVVVCPSRKDEESSSWSESTCPVCLADGEPVRVLPECMHYFHADCIDTWLRGSPSCLMCRTETTPTPSPGDDLHRQLQEILVAT